MGAKLRHDVKVNVVVLDVNAVVDDVDGWLFCWL
jgi:hypothetical protein